jgi:hypothetical protein
MWWIWGISRSTIIKYQLLHSFGCFEGTYRIWRPQVGPHIWRRGDCFVQRPHLAGIRHYKTFYLKPENYSKNFQQLVGDRRDHRFPISTIAAALVYFFFRSCTARWTAVSKMWLIVGKVGMNEAFIALNDSIYCSVNCTCIFSNSPI